MSKINVERFWSYVNKAGECWFWTGYIDPDGYGTFRVEDKKYRAHRVSLAISRNCQMEDLDSALVADHTCKMRGCVRPDHLEEVEPIENLLRGDNPTAIMLLTGKCQRGHDNIGTRKDGKRFCIDCQRINNRMYYKLKKGR